MEDRKEQRKKFMFSLSLNFTISKIIAIIILIVASVIDFSQKTGGRVLTFAIPFITVMLGVKQFIDNQRENRKY